MADSSRKRIWEGWESALACLLMALESDSWCIHPTALWTGDSLGWGWLEGCSLILPRASFLCGFILRWLKLTSGLSHWWAPTVSVWGLPLPWLMVGSCLGKMSLQHLFSGSTTIILSFLKLASEDCLGNTYVFHPCNWPVHHKWTWGKMDSMLGRLAVLKTCLFDAQSCHLMPRMECKQCWWKRSSSLICFW